MEEELAKGGIVSGNTPVHLGDHCCCILTEKQREQFERLLPAQSGDVHVSFTFSGGSEPSTFREVVENAHRICDLHGIRRVE